MKFVSNQAGLTMLELLIAIVVASAAFVVFSQFVATGLSSYRRQDTNLILQTNTKLAVENVAQVVREAKRVQSANSNPDDNSPGAPGNLYSWSSSTGAGATLILGIPARDANNNFIYIDGQHASVYLNDIVFYLGSDDILYKRVIKNTAAPGNTAITTCPPNLATPGCPADAKVVEDIADLAITYFDSSNNVIATPTGTEAVEVKLKQTRRIGGHTYSNEFTTIATLRNK